MSIIMLGRSLRDNSWTIFWYALGLFLYGVLIVALYPSVRLSAATLEQSFQALPPTIRNAFGLTGFDTLAAYSGAEFLNLIWPLTVSVFAIMAGSATIAQEIERGTIELLLSVPQTRVRLLTAKLAAVLTGVLLLIGTTALALVLGSWLFGGYLTAVGLLAAAIVEATFATAVSCYSVLFSSFSNERAPAAAFAGVLTLGFYLAWIVSGISTRLHWLAHLTVFSVYQPQQALTSGQVNIFGICIVLALASLSTAAALVVFDRRDIAA